ncbi:hypothetical protein [Lewinella sp. IMCC34183]|uniref:hypothetical protein n=1 Tax=Lewinella sp. IMCC34183 TaxID=2248762 RepID=UPI000E25FFD1|nr:hypothetical protein [Lewinella sp. IMCC34183]
MNNIYTVLRIFLCALLPYALAASADCATCTVTKKNGKLHYSEACSSPKSVCTIDLARDLGSVDLLTFVDLREVTVILGEGTYPKFLSSTLVSAGTYFETDLTDGVHVGLDVVAAAGNRERIRGLESVGFLNGILLDLSALICLNIDINLFGGSGSYIGPCTLGDRVVFPVELLSWTTEPTAAGLASDWQTVSEREADYYRLLHSTDGATFTELTRIPAAGTTDGLSTYNYVHGDPSPGVNYYRLEQYDYDGTVHTLGVRTARWSGTGADRMTAYPNPASPGARIRLSTAAGDHAEVRLVGPTGRVVRSYRLPDSGELTLPTDLPSGCYYLQRGETAMRLLVSR